MTHARAVFLMVVVTLLWSIAGVVTRHLDAAQSFEVTFWRSGFSALALAAALSFMRGPALWRGLLHSPPVVWISAGCWAAMFTAFMIAITLTTVANVLITLAMGPLITALFARIFLHHTPTRTWLAIGLAGFGIVWMFGREAGVGVSLLGTLIALTIPCASSINYTTLQLVGNRRERGAGKDGPQDMLPAIFLGAMLSAAATLPLAWPLNTSVHDLALLAFLGILQLAIPCLLVVRLSRELPAPEIALLALLEVIFGVTWAWLGAGERPAAGTLTGGMLVLGALAANEFLSLRQRLGKPLARPAGRGGGGPGSR